MKKYLLLIIIPLISLFAEIINVDLNQTELKFDVIMQSKDTIIVTISESRFKSLAPSNRNYIPQSSIACIQKEAMIDAFNSVVYIGLPDNISISGLKPNTKYDIAIHDTNYRKIDSLEFKTLKIPNINIKK